MPTPHGDNLAGRRLILASASPRRQTCRRSRLILPPRTAANPHFSPAIEKGGHLLENPRRGFTEKAGGNAPGNRRWQFDPAERDRTNIAHNGSGPFGVGANLLSVPGAFHSTLLRTVSGSRTVPPAIYRLPFQGNEIRSPEFSAAEKCGLQQIYCYCIALRSAVPSGLDPTTEIHPRICILGYSQSPLRGFPKTPIHHL